MYAFLKTALPYIFCFVAAYLAGTVNFAWLTARKKGFDIRTRGSGNPGTTNAGRTMGLGAGAAVFIGDVVKSSAMVFSAGFLFPNSPAIEMVTTVGCVMGHMYPFYLDFKGGKGIAVLLGSALALNWKLFLILLAGIAAITFLTDYLFIGNLTAIAGYWIWCLLSGRSVPELAMLFCLVALSFWKHRGNISRLLSGREVGIRASLAKNRQTKPGKKLSESEQKP